MRWPTSKRVLTSPLSPVRAAILTALLLVSACSPTSRGIPRYDDVEGSYRALKSLSPWQDGSPDRSNDGHTFGDQNSDRQLFFRWFQRYSDYETFKQHDRDYRPFPVPATIGEAIRQQREFEVEEARKSDANAAKIDREAALAAANRAAREKVYLSEQAAEKVRNDQNLADERQREAAETAKSVEIQAQNAKISEEVDRKVAAEQRCRDRRGEAAYAALDRDGGEAYHRVWDSFKCKN